MFRSITIKLWLFGFGVLAAVVVLMTISLQGMRQTKASAERIRYEAVPMLQCVYRAGDALRRSARIRDEALVTVTEPEKFDDIRQYEGRLQAMLIQFDMYMKALIWGSESAAFQKSAGGLTLAEWDRHGLQGKLVVPKVSLSIRRLASEADLYFAGFSNNANQVLKGHKRALRMARAHSANTQDIVQQVLRDRNESSQYSDLVDDSFQRMTKDVDGYIQQLLHNVTVVQHAAWVNLVLASLSLLFFVVLWGYLLFSRIIIKPIQLLLNGIEAVRGGKRGVQVAIHSGDEFEQLAQSFNRMSTNLEQTTVARDDLMQEMTERKQAEEALQRTNVRLNELAALKDDFVAKVSHELRTPLTSVKEGLNLLVDNALGPTTDEQRDFLRIMDQDIDRLTNLVNNMLDLSKIEAGRLPLYRQPLDIRKTMEAVFRSYQPFFGSRTMTKEWSDVPLVFGDSDRLFQVFGNLLSNAVKFTADNGTIIVRTTHQGDAVLIAIIDNGPGVAADELPKLFKKFSQVGARGLNQPKGTGLGLVICRELVALHKGQVTVTSQLGHGTTFTVALPCYRPAFALAETFQQLEGSMKREGESTGLIAIQTGSQRNAQLVDALRGKVKREDVVLDLEPSWVVILTMTDHAGLTAMVRRLRELEAMRGLRCGIALSPNDGAEAGALFEHATRTLDQGLAYDATAIQ